MQKTLDLSIKLHETGTLDGGYAIADWVSYPAYMKNDEWSDFYETMKAKYPIAFAEYGEGSGGELLPKNKYPPKMASYGSSSRMIFNLLKENSDFHFEYKLPTKVGGIANLDGFIETTDTNIYVEAKCREPYGKKTHLIDKCYKDLYEHITSDNSCNISIEATETDKKINVHFFVDEREITVFDIKQMICHLLGIGVKLLTESKHKKTKFLYLCYNPKLIDIIDERKKKQIFDTYDKMCNECQAIDFGALFASIIRYLRDVLHVGQPLEIETIKNFDFILCNQNDYLKYISTEEQT